MATYGRDSKGEYKIRDDGTKVYRTSENSKYFPNDYGGTAGWYTTQSSASSSGSKTTASNKSSSSSGSKSSSSSWNYNDQNWNDPDWVKGYLSDLQRRREQGLAQGYDVSHIDKEYQRVYQAGLDKGYWGNYIGGSVSGSGRSGSGELPSQAPSTPEEMMQYLWQLGLLNQTPYPEIPEYRPLEPPVLSFSEAQRRAETQLGPLYDDLLKRVAAQSAQNLEQSGLFGSLYGEKLRQDAALNVENKRLADIAGLANQLVNKSEEEARYLEAQNYQRWRDFVSDMVNQYAANRAARQDQTALLAQMLTYLTGREDTEFSKWLQREQLGLQKDQWGFQKEQTEWERSGFPNQYEYQKALAKLEASLKPKSSGSSDSKIDKTTAKNLNISYYRQQMQNMFNRMLPYLTNSRDAYNELVKKINEDEEMLIYAGLSMKDIEDLKEYAKILSGYKTGEEKAKEREKEDLDQLLNSLY